MLARCFKAGVVFWLAVACLVPAPALLGATQITVDDTADISSGDPRLGGFQTDFDTTLQMCDALVTFDANSKVVPQLARSWKVPNPTTYEFTLRPAKFQDGTPVTAEDVKATMDRILDPAFKSTILAPDFEPVVKSTEVIDAQTVRFNLKIPYPAFLNRLVYIFPVSQRAVRELGDQEFAHHPICAGPYKLAEWVPDDHRVLDAFDGYWGGRPKVDRIVIKPVPAGATRVAALQAREVDLAVSIPPDLLESVRRDPRLKLIENNSGRRILFFLNTYAKPFNDKRVRQAVNYAVDWSAIIKSLMGGLGNPLPGIAGHYVFGYTPVRGYEYNPVKTKQLLAEAGYANGFDLILETPNGHYFQDREISQAVAGYLRNVGINATVNVYEWGQYAGRKRERKFAMGLWASLPNYRDFDDLGFNLEPTRASSFYDNPEVNRLFEEGRSENDAAKRKVIYGQLTNVIEADAPILFGPEIVQAYGMSAQLRWQPWPGSDMLFGLRNATLH